MNLNTDCLHLIVLGGEKSYLIVQQGYKCYLMQIRSEVAKYIIQRRVYAQYLQVMELGYHTHYSGARVENYSNPAVPCC